MSSAAQFLHVVVSVGASDPSSPENLSLPLQEPDRSHALSFCVTCVLTSSHSVSSSCGCVQSARIAYPCFPRPRFELRLSSRVPSQRSQRWPVDRSAHLTDVASSLRLRHRCALTPCVGEWQHRTPLFFVRRTSCALPARAPESKPSTWVTALSLPTVGRSACHGAVCLAVASRISVWPSIVSFVRRAQTHTHRAERETSDGQRSCQFVGRSVLVMEIKLLFTVVSVSFTSAVSAVNRSQSRL